jgi:hypothetical protein
MTTHKLVHSRAVYTITMLPLILAPKQHHTTPGKTSGCCRTAVATPSSLKLVQEYPDVFVLKDGALRSLDFLLHLVLLSRDYGKCWTWAQIRQALKAGG